LQLSGILRIENQAIKSQMLKNKILTVDIGNTVTKFGILDDSKLQTCFSTLTAAKFQDLTKHLKDERFSAVIACSVVPEVENLFKEICSELFGIEPFIVTHQLDLDLSIKYEPLENLGTDRLVTAISAIERYGCPLIVCDFGTATTIDAINSKREFLGGVIFPGVDMLAEALHEKTAKLPKVTIEKPEKVIGHSTTQCIQSGIFYGYIGFVERIISEMIKEMNEDARIIATGGKAKFFSEALNVAVDENLTLEGLKIIFNKFIK
jgi:type III pantothenate kinase